MKGIRPVKGTGIIWSNSGKMDRLNKNDVMTAMTVIFCMCVA